MKQGRPTRDVNESAKREPNPKAIGVGAVGRIGGKYVYSKTPESMHQGRGYKAPMAGSKVHPSGSQGKK